MCEWEKIIHGHCGCVADHNIVHRCILARDSTEAASGGSDATLVCHQTDIINTRQHPERPYCQSCYQRELQRIHQEHRDTDDVLIASMKYHDPDDLSVQVEERSIQGQIREKEYSIQRLQRELQAHRDSNCVVDASLFRAMRCWRKEREDLRQERRNTGDTDAAMVRVSEKYQEEMERVRREYRDVENCLIASIQADEQALSVLLNLRAELRQSLKDQSEEIRLWKQQMGHCDVGRSLSVDARAQEFEFLMDRSMSSPI
ncbi:hypothetical protein MMC12_003723 [Toensbergia leucococca]|nr:hypothetical protein [Toensbergia leucococca]